MARFPLSEADIVRLAQLLAAGLETHVDDFPSPPVSAQRLLRALGSYQPARQEAIAAQAAAVMKTSAKVEALKVVKELVKANLRYAENHTHRDPVKLSALGWRKPVDGGPVAAYKVQRRRRGVGEWTDVAVSIRREITLSDQETGVELEYRIIAINREGEGGPSNLARAVL